MNFLVSIDFLFKMSKNIFSPLNWIFDLFIVEQWIHALDNYQINDLQVLFYFVSPFYFLIIILDAQIYFNKVEFMYFYCCLGF